MRGFGRHMTDDWSLKIARAVLKVRNFSEFNFALRVIIAGNSLAFSWIVILGTPYSPPNPQKIKVTQKSLLSHFDFLGVRGAVGGSQSHSFFGELLPATRNVRGKNQCSIFWPLLLHGVSDRGSFKLKVGACVAHSQVFFANVRLETQRFNGEQNNSNCKQSDPQHNCKQRNATASRKLPIASKKAASHDKVFGIGPVFGQTIYSQQSY